MYGLDAPGANRRLELLPGSPNGALLGLKELIIPEMDHIKYELSK